MATSPNPQPLAGRRIGLLTSAASRLNGGVFEAVVLQAGMIRRLGGEAVVFALADEHSQEDAVRLAPSPVRLAQPVGPRQVGYSPALTGMLLDAELDLLHLHGIWMYPSKAGSEWARKTGRPYLVSPHGMLDPWITGRGRLKKAIARTAYERASWASAAALHALTGREAEDIARESGRRDSVVIPNPGPPVTQPTAPRRALRFGYLGRIHPKKNLAPLVEAWAALARSGDLPADAQLEIAGWGDPADVAAMEVLIGDAPQARFLGPQFGADKDRLMTQSRFVVLPSLSEGLPMAVLEAWAAGTPVLMTPECNIPDGFEAGAAMDCGYDAQTIGACLKRAMTMSDEEWNAMSDAAISLASGPFSEASVSALWAKTYCRLIAESVAT